MNGIIEGCGEGCLLSCVDRRADGLTDGDKEARVLGHVDIQELRRTDGIQVGELCQRFEENVIFRGIFGENEA